jgi:hypothetical protein
VDLYVEFTVAIGRHRRVDVSMRVLYVDSCIRGWLA